MCRKRIVTGVLEFTVPPFAEMTATYIQSELREEPAPPKQGAVIEKSVTGLVE